MYIPPFVCGFIIGAIVGALLLIVIALIAYKSDKSDKNK